MNLVFAVALVFAAVGPEKGSLVLQGGGATNPRIKARFVALALAGGAKARIVVIPTASTEIQLSADRLERERKRSAEIFGIQDVTVIHTRDRKVADSEALVAPLRRATGVWIYGGDEGLLADAYQGTRTEREIAAVVGRGDVAGGTSAGADILASSFVRVPLDIPALPRKQVNEHIAGGFGLIANTLIFSHFTQRHMEEVPSLVLASHPGLRIIGLDEETAIVVHGDQIEAVGKNSVHVYQGGQQTHLTNGQHFDLAG